MRFKLDENADPRWRQPLELAGHVVSTIAEEHLSGAFDEQVAATCRNLNLCLITGHRVSGIRESSNGAR